MIIRIRSIWSPQVARGRYAPPMNFRSLFPWTKLYSLFAHSAPSVRCAVWHAVESFGLPKERDAQIDACVDRVSGSEFR